MFFDFGPDEIKQCKFWEKSREEFRGGLMLGNGDIIDASNGEVIRRDKIALYPSLKSDWEGKYVAERYYRDNDYDYADYFIVEVYQHWQDFSNNITGGRFWS